MPADMLMAVLLAGAGTYLIRYLPMRGHRPSDRPAGIAARFLAAVGPASVAALLALSLLPLGGPAVGWGPRLAVAAGLAAVWALHRATGNIALATLGGAAAYGMAAALG